MILYKSDKLCSRRRQAGHVKLVKTAYHCMEQKMKSVKGLLAKQAGVVITSQSVQYIVT